MHLFLPQPNLCKDKEELKKPNQYYENMVNYSTKQNISIKSNLTIFNQLLYSDIREVNLVIFWVFWKIWTCFYFQRKNMF